MKFRQKPYFEPKTFKISLKVLIWSCPDLKSPDLDITGKDNRIKTTIDKERQNIPKSDNKICNQTIHFTSEESQMTPLPTKNTSVPFR